MGSSWHRHHRQPQPSIANMTGIDEQTIRYLELVSGKKGLAAVVAWVRFTGYAGDDDKRTTESQRLAKAKANATMYFAECAAQQMGAAVA